MVSGDLGGQKAFAQIANMAVSLRESRASVEFSQPAKSKRGREEGDGTENVINCRDVCHKLS